MALVVGVGSGCDGGGVARVSLLTMYTSEMEGWVGDDRDRIGCVEAGAISDVHSPVGEWILPVITDLVPSFWLMMDDSMGIWREDCRWRKHIGHSSLTF